MSKKTKFFLSEKHIPEAWYNIQADLPQPLPPVMHPGTGEPIGPEDLAPLFPMALIGQEVSQERWIEIPDPVRDVLRLWRPTPLYRAHRLEKVLDTPAHIYYKYEGVSPVGSHKPNTAVAQAFYNREEASGPHDRDRRRPVGSCSRWRAASRHDLRVYMVRSVRRSRTGTS
jgi:tryptophan synthase beta chain